MTLVAPVPLEPADAVGGVHFIAIGGAGMSGIAAAYAELGVAVSGSDRADSETLRGLAAHGITTYVGHDAAHLGDARTVVVSSAIRADNVELVEAHRRGLRVWHRSAALGALMLGRTGIAISGTHGKTTTTGMLATMLIGLRLGPGYVIGSPLSTTGLSSAIGTGPTFVIEADESDGSFLQYPAALAVITNVEADHLDNWGTAEAYLAGFVTFGSGAGVELIVASADDPGARAVAERLRATGRRVVTYGEAADADVRLSDCRFDAWGAHALINGEPLDLRVPGRYNLANAAAAYAVGLHLGFSDRRHRAAMRAALGDFAGTHRRFEFKGEAGGVRVFDDYAHHPTEVAATLAAARPLVGDGRLVACFQPHLFSRTAEYADEFAAALVGADVIVTCGVYPAREDAIAFPGVTGRLVSDAVAGLGREVTYVEDIADAPDAVAALVRPGDLVLTLGAGDVTTAGAPLVAAIARRVDVP